MTGALDLDVGHDQDVLIVAYEFDLEDGMRFMSHQQSYRVTKTGQRYMTKDYTDYVKYLRERISDMSNLDGLLAMPLSLVVKFYYPPPKRTKQSVRLLYKTTPPDLVNIVKPVEDAMEGVVYESDKQIVRYDGIAKYYNRDIILPRIEIYLIELEPRNVQTLPIPGLGPE